MKIGIYGSGGLGREILNLVKQINANSSRWDEYIFIDDTKCDKECKGCKLLPLSSLASQYTPDQIEIVIAVGEPRNRSEMFNRVKNLGYGFATLIHPSVQISSDVIIGVGTIINAGTIISCDAKIGINVYMQPYVCIGHDCCIGDNCVLSSLVFLGGASSIGNETYIAPNSAIRDSITVGAQSIVGMGSIVMRDVADCAIVMGNPARKIQENDDHKVFK